MSRHRLQLVPPNRGTVRVLIVDDHALFAEALMLMLSIDARIEIVGYASDGAEGASLAEALQPDVVLMDVHMPNVDGIQATQRIRGMWPRPEVVIVTGESSAETKRYALAAGAARYLTKDTPARTLIDAIVAVKNRQVATVTQLRAHPTEIRAGR